MTGRLLSVVVISVWLGAPCLASEAGREAPASGSLERLGIEVAGEPRPIAGLEVSGLATIDEAQLFALVEKPEAPFDFARAAAFVEALDASGAFARVEPRLRIGASGEPTLAVRLSEHPRVEAVAFEGLEEVPESELLPELLGVPEASEQTGAKAPFASLSGETLLPGILRGGVNGAVTRLVTRLFAAGYLMVDVRGVLSADGRLSVMVAEGRIEEVRLVGPAPRLWPAVREALDLPAGRTFDETELDDALERVERALPFVRREVGPHPTRTIPDVVLSEGADGATRFALSERPPVVGPGVFGVEGRRLTLYLRPRLHIRFRYSPDELLRHTPVGGFGIGLQTETKLWDPKDRLHLRLDTFAGTADSAAQEALGKEDAGGEYEVALCLRVPPLRIADISAGGHGLFDTSDAWRTGRQTSYLDSLLFDRPDREYYWREGGAFSLTLQPSERLLVGVEYRIDSYRSIQALAEPATFFNHDERFVNPPIQEGDSGSLVLRAELLSRSVHPEQIRGLFRTPETSLVTQDRAWGLRTGYQLLATLEIARPGLGSDEALRFTRLVSDNMAFLATGPASGLRLRARIAGGSNLPLQKQEALGGWSALRGYEFKELRGGDWSWLGSVEYRHEWLSGFVDLGSVRRPQGWSGPHAGAGLKLHFDGLPLVGPWLKNRRLLPPTQLAVAWRLDRAGKAEPSVRLLVGQLF